MIPAEQLKLSIRKYVSLSEQDWELFLPYIRFKSFSKGEVLLRQEDVCRFICFVISGTVIYYQLTNKGEELTTDFAFECDWVTDNRSRVSETPAHLNIKAWEDTELAFIQQKDLELLFLKVPRMERLGRLLVEEAYVKLVQRSVDLQTLSAKERYQKLATEYPQAFLRLPLYHIANYLGIAPKSLSRIRNKK
jgi:CRP/FNR family transcriptional regulator, anaerobic regulatory protein